MPTYTYRCEDNHETEIVYKMSEKPNQVECPLCHKVAYSIITSGNFILMGYGWYEGGNKK